MFNIESWKNHIYKKDLLGVLINALVVAIFLGIAMGAFDYLLTKLGVNISFGLLLLAFFIGFRVRKGYYSYHPLYPLLAILFLLFGVFIEYLTTYVFLFGTITSIPTILSSLNFYYTTLLYPVYAIVSCTKSFDGFLLLNGIITLIIYILDIIFCFKLSGGRIK